MRKYLMSSSVAGVLAVLLVIAIGCPAGVICVKPLKLRPDDLIIELSRGNRPKSCKEGPVYVSAIRFVRNSDKKMIWKIVHDGIDKVQTIKYGEIPEGFRGTASEPLVVGDVIDIYVHGQYVRGGNRVVIER